MFLLFPLLKVGVLGGSAQPPLLSSHYALYLGALIPASRYHIYAGGSPIYFCSPAFPFRGAGLCTQLPSGPRCHLGPQSQHIKTEFIIFLFNLSLSGNRCPDKQHHHPPWLPETSHPQHQTSQGTHPLLFAQNPLQPGAWSNTTTVQSCVHSGTCWPLVKNPLLVSLTFLDPKR